MGCIIPKAVILFQWYEPLKRFIMMKRLEMDCLIPRIQINPFSLIFSSAASNSDFPLVRINISNNIFLRFVLEFIEMRISKLTLLNWISKKQKSKNLIYNLLILTIPERWNIFCLEQELIL